MTNEPTTVEDMSQLPDIPESRRGARRTHVAEAETLGKQLKIGRTRHFEIYCDEPPTLGGEDRYPQPLAYIAAGVGF